MAQAEQRFDLRSCIVARKITGLKIPYAVGLRCATLVTRIRYELPVKDSDLYRGGGALYRIMCLGIAVALLALSPQASAQPYPNRTIKVIVPYTPGTAMDVIARTVGEKMSQRLGQAVVVEDRPGATGTIGSNAVAKAPPDGYTLLMANINIVIAPLLYKSVPFNPLTDFAPITVAGYSVMTLAASNKSGFRTGTQMIAYAKANPGKLNYSSPGIGTTQYLSMEALKNAAGVDLMHVPYKGSAGALTALLRGEVDVAFLPIDLAISHFKAGELKILAVGSPLRHPMLPDVPTLQESGVPGAESNPWHAFLAPRDTPRSIIDKLNTEIRSILAMPEVRSKLEGFGLRIESGSPEDLKALMQRDSERSAEIIRRNRISIDY